MNPLDTGSLEARGAEHDRKQVLASIDRETGEILDPAHWMSANPELSPEEHQTKDRRVGYVTARDVTLARGRPSSTQASS